MFFRVLQTRIHNKISITNGAYKMSRRPLNQKQFRERLDQESK